MINPALIYTLLSIPRSQSICVRNNTGFKIQLLFFIPLSNSWHSLVPDCLLTACGGIMYSGHQTSINTPGGDGWWEEKDKWRYEYLAKTKQQNFLASPQSPQFAVLLKGKWKPQQGEFLQILDQVILNAAEKTAYPGCAGMSNYITEHSQQAHPGNMPLRK